MRAPVGQAWEQFESLEPRTLLAAVTWDGGGGDTSWHNPLNWSGDVLPGPSDDVTIDVPGQAPTILFNQQANASIHSLTCNDGLSLSAGSISVAADWRQNGLLTVNGGSVGGAGNLVINTQALWTAGSITGSGRVQVLLGKRLTIAGNVTLGRTLVNNGVLTWASGNLATTGVTIYNLADRVLNAQSTGSLTSSGPVSTLINSGTLKRNGTSTSGTLISISVNSPGIIDVLQGTLTLSGPVSQVTGTTLSGGDWRVSATSSHLEIPGRAITTIAAGTSVLLNGPHSTFLALAGLAMNLGHLTLVGDRNLDVNPVGGVFTNGGGGSLVRTGNGSTVIAPARLTNLGSVMIQGGVLRPSGGLVGAGTITIGAGAFLLFDGAAATIAGATLSGSGAMQISTWVTWTLGTWSGPGPLTIAAGGTLALLGPGAKVLGRPTTSNGAIRWIDGPWQLAGVTLFNAGTATFSYAGALSAGGTGSGFANTGTLIKQGAGALTLQGANGGVAFTNSGVVQVQQGRLILNGGGTSGGQFAVSAGSDLTFGGLAGTLTGAVLTGAGTLTIANATTWTGGTIQGPGTMSITAPASLSIVAGATTLNRSLSNSGTLTWSGGLLTLGSITVTNNAQLNMSAPSSVVTSGPARLVNTGTLTKTGGGTTSLLIADLTLDNTGTVRVLGGELALDGTQIVQVAGPTLMAGTWSATNASLRFVGAAITTNRAVVRLNGFSATLPSLEPLARNEGTIEINDGCQVQITPAGGTFANAGSFTLDRAAFVQINGNIVLESTSALNVIIAGIVPQSDFGLIQATGSVTLGGTLSASYTNGYSPPTGVASTVLIAPSASGMFAMSLDEGLPAGEAVQFQFSGTTGRIVVIPG